MNAEFYAAKALADEVRATRTLHRPLQVWPGEQRLVTLADLPVVGATLRREQFGEPTRKFQVSTTAQLQTHLTVGKKYAKIGADETGIVIGEW